jgi:hypothetical protein
MCSRSDTRGHILEEMEMETSDVMDLEDLGLSVATHSRLSDEKRLEFETLVQPSVITLQKREVKKRKNNNIKTNRRDTIEIGKQTEEDNEKEEVVATVPPKQRSRNNTRLKEKEIKNDNTIDEDISFDQLETSTWTSTRVHCPPLTLELENEEETREEFNGQVVEEEGQEGEEQDQEQEDEIDEGEEFKAVGYDIPGTQKVYLKTYGCSHNSSDSEYMAGLLAEQGYQITEDFSNADVYLMNSCTVKNPSQDSFFNLVDKAKVTGKPVIVAGCVPQGSLPLPIPLAFPLPIPLLSLLPFPLLPSSSSSSSLSASFLFLLPLPPPLPLLPLFFFLLPDLLLQVNHQTLL